MSENSPGTREAPSVGSDLKVSALSDPFMIKALTIFHDLCASSFGPHGRMKVIHNNVGGHVTVTSSCDRLLCSMAFSNPVIKLIVSAVIGHLQRFHDGGLFIITFATGLIKTSLDSPVPRHLLIELYGLFLRQGIDILNDNFPCMKELDYAEPEDVKVLIRSILSTKVGCCLFGDDTDFMVTLLFRAFLSVCPRGANCKYGTLTYMTAEGLPIEESSLYEGVLIDTPHILPYQVDDWSLLKPTKGQKFLIAVFSMSLTGDAEESVDANYEIEETVDVSSAMLKSIEQLMDHVIESDVRLVCCQRVIHPKIKSYLRRNEITTIDRLGKANIQSVKQVAGGQLIGSLSQGFDEGSFGSLDDISAVVVNRRSYLYLRSREAQVSTVVLGHRTEEALEELKNTCMKCEEILKITLRDNRLLCGGGCWQSVLIAEIKRKATEKQENIKETLGCSSHQMQAALTNFSGALASSLCSLDKNSSHLTDSANQHHWRIDNCDKDCDWSIYPDSCECGAVVKTEDTELTFLNETSEMKRISSNHEVKNCEVLDSFPAMTNAFQTSVSVANLVLGIENITIDKN